MSRLFNRSVLVIGAARQGLAVTRYLSRQGAHVTVTDQQPAAKLASAIESLAEYPIEWDLGGHSETVLDGKDLVCVSGGVSLTSPLVLGAIKRGIPLTNDSQLFMEAVPCRTIGITGSSGKTTTTTLVGRMAERSLPAGSKAWVGGNIGTPLIDHLDDISAKDLVILELSSFQLELMTKSPDIAAILNITPNHLDRHGTFEAYTAAKAHLLHYQSPVSYSVLGRDDLTAWSLRKEVRGRLVTFSFDELPEQSTGTYLNGKQLVWQDEEHSEMFLETDEISLRGRHNIANVLAAAAICFIAGFPAAGIAAGVKGFGGVAHRLEFVRSLNGVRWYNDSIATAPERALAAVKSFDEPITLLLGGRDKNLDWSELAELVHRKVNHVIVFGEAAPKILAALGDVKTGQSLTSIDHVDSVELAVNAAKRVTEPGGVVLLSPGGTSYDAFRDFEERGEAFRKWVNLLQ